MPGYAVSYAASNAVAGGSLNWDLGLERATSGTGTIGTGTNTTAITIGRTGITTTLPGALTVTQAVTLSAQTQNSLLYAGAAGLVTSLGAATNGQIPIGSSGAAPVLATITGTSNQITVGTGAGSITLSLPQSIATSSSPTFAGLTLTSLTDNSLVYSASDVLTSLGAATNGQIPIGSSGAAPVLATITGTANQVVVGTGAGSITLSLPQSIATSSNVQFGGLGIGTAGSAGLIIAAAGSQSAPSIVFAGDTDAGFYSAGTNTFYAAAGNVQIARFLESGGSTSFAATSMVATDLYGGTTGGGASSTTAMTVTTFRSLAITQSAMTSGTQTGFTFTSGAHTGLTASTEAPAVDFDTDATVQFAQGALTTQRNFIVRAPTYAFATGASTLSTASTVAITGLPSVSTNATITNSYAISLAITGTLASVAGLTAAAIDIAASTLTLTGTTQVTSAGPAMIRVGIATITDASSITVDTAASIYIAGAPAAAGSVTLTSTYSLWVDAGSSRFDGRVLQSQGANVASAGTLTLGADGNFFSITGTTTINHVTTTGWTQGSIVGMRFNGNITVSNNAASPPAGTAPMLLAGSTDFSATSGDTLLLVLDGTNWRELARTAI